jgi:Flp pilus assembly secretin CpaC
MLTDSHLECAPLEFSAMRRFCLFAIVALAAVQSAAAETKTVTVTLDKASLIRMPPKALTLVIGNPSIADVTVLKNNGMMVITGKSFGETNLIAVDADGSPVAESVIRVVQGADAMMVVQRGTERETYNCAPRCLPVVQLGDGRVFGEAVAQVTARNAIANPPKQ